MEIIVNQQVLNRCITEGKFATICRLIDGMYQLCIHYYWGINHNYTTICESKSYEELKIWWDMQGSPLPLKIDRY